MICGCVYLAAQSRENLSPRIYGIISVGRREKKLETKISWHSNDIILKATAEAFRGQTLEALGLSLPPIVEMLPTVLPVAEVKEERIDFLFRLADESLLHLEFQTTVSDTDMFRFAGYGEELTQSELVRLIFLPLMRHREREGEIALKAAELAKRIKNEKQNLVFAAIIALSDKYLTENEKKRLLEVIAMTQIEQWIREEGRIEGRIEGKIEGKKETAQAALREGLSVEMVAKITGLSLEEVLKMKKQLEQ